MGGIELSWGEVFGFISILIAAFGAMSTYIWRARAASSKQIKDVEDKLTDFQLSVAQNYVSSAALMVMEQNLIRSEERTLGAINNLAERLDRYLTKTTLS